MINPPRRVGNPGRIHPLISKVFRFMSFVFPIPFIPRICGGRTSRKGMTDYMVCITTEHFYAAAAFANFRSISHHYDTFSILRIVRVLRGCFFTPKGHKPNCQALSRKLADTWVLRGATLLQSAKSLP